VPIEKQEVRSKRKTYKYSVKKTKIKLIRHGFMYTIIQQFKHTSLGLG
jgi:hypothetical protein